VKNGHCPATVSLLTEASPRTCLQYSAFAGRLAESIRLESQLSGEGWAFYFLEKYIWAS